MSDEIHRHAGFAINLFLERENHEDALEPALNPAHATRPPSPNLRADEINDSNAVLLQSARQAAGSRCSTSVIPTTAISDASATISTPASRIFGPPMPKKCALVRACSARASCAAYMSPEASPAEMRISGGAVMQWTQGIRWAECSRAGEESILRGVSALAAPRPNHLPAEASRRAHRQKLANEVPGLCIGADRGGNKSRGARAVPGACLLRAACSCETQVSGQRVELC